MAKRMKSIGETVADWREAAGLSVRQLADKCELTPQTIRNIEAGRILPSFSALSVILGVTAGESLLAVLQRSVTVPRRPNAK